VQRCTATAITCISLGLLAGTSAAIANQPPDASFGVFPTTPAEGQTVRFVSYACDPDGAVFDQQWDLDDDGRFDDAFGANVVGTFQAGSHRIRLRVVPVDGAPVVRTRAIDVVPSLVAPETFTPPLLNPFPVVRITGQLTGAGARIGFLSVRAPVCSTVTTLCRGRSCPFRRARLLVGRHGSRVRSLAGKSLRAGVKLEVLVTKRDRIGKYTRFEIRRNKPPSRVDGCLRFGATAPGDCA